MKKIFVQMSKQLYPNWNEIFKNKNMQSFNRINQNSYRFFVRFDSGGVCGPRSRCCLGEEDGGVRRLRLLSRLERFFRDGELLKTKHH
jgi:hypothetical protein